MKYDYSKFIAQSYHRRIDPETGLLMYTIIEDIYEDDEDWHVPEGLVSYDSVTNWETVDREDLDHDEYPRRVRVGYPQHVLEVCAANAGIVFVPAQT